MIRTLVSWVISVNAIVVPCRPPLPHSNLFASPFHSRNVVKIDTPVAVDFAVDEGLGRPVVHAASVGGEDLVGLAAGPGRGRA